MGRWASSSSMKEWPRRTQLGRPINGARTCYDCLRNYISMLCLFCKVDMYWIVAYWRICSSFQESTAEAVARHRHDISFAIRGAWVHPTGIMLWPTLAARSHSRPTPQCRLGARYNKILGRPQGENTVYPNLRYSSGAILDLLLVLQI